MSSKGFFYIASPYSKYPDGIYAAYRMACFQSSLLVRAGVPVFSPIAHSHMIAVAGGIDPFDHAIWLPADKPLMDASRGLIMLMADSWRESYGMQKELEAFKAAGKPIVYMQPNVVPPELLEE